MVQSIKNLIIPKDVFAIVDILFYSYVKLIANL